VNPRRLYRSRRDRRIAGVAGGVADYLEVDPTVVRVLWVITIFFGGIGILLYIVMAFIVPLEPLDPAAPPQGWAPLRGASSTVPGWQAPGPAAQPAQPPAPPHPTDVSAPASPAPVEPSAPADQASDR
jgi:phage shock protein PspC (stress-responsive transcriptional regulator)